MATEEKKTKETPEEIKKKNEEKLKKESELVKEGHQSNANDKEMATLKKEHPERFVDGKYYEDEEDLKKAQEEYAKKQEAALAHAREVVAEQKSKRDAADAKITKALYGDQPDISPDQMKQTVGGIEMDAILGNAEQVRKRQHLLDPTDYENDVKKPNPGKFPNNQDAFPVDLKIEELEVHKPDVKIHEIVTHIHGQAAAAAAMLISDTAEKRLIHLENNMATLMRYLFRLGSRVHINCQYWGGTTPFEKYKCIRCMHDDRISDGQMVQIDQCMNCTRYEPVYGQVYELMNDLGANVAAILDDNQMGYADMEDYVDLARTERFIKAKENGEFDLTKVLTRDTEETDFDATWGEGIKMNWEPVAKEDQKCHINWRQSINDDGSNMARLPSFPKDEIENGNIVTSSASQANGGMTKEYEAMEQCTRAELKPFVDEGKKAVKDTDAMVTAMKNGLINQVREKIGNQQIDPLTVCCLHLITNESVDSVIKKYQDMAGSLGTKNIGLIVSGIACGNNAVKGSKPDDIHPIEEVGKCSANYKSDSAKSGDSKSSDSKGGNEKQHYDTAATDLPKLDPEKKDEWLWVDYGPALVLNAKENKTSGHEGLFCKVVYLYHDLQKFIRTSPFDTEDFAFPYTEEQMKQFNGVHYTSAFGPRGDRIHRGVDLQPASQSNEEVHAVHDGTVTGAGDGWGADWHSVNIDHGDGTYSRYLHLNTISVQKGQRVSKGDVVGTTGQWGPKGANEYALHLHLEIAHGNSEADYSNEDPMKFFNCTGIGKGNTLFADGSHQAYE